MKDLSSIVAKFKVQGTVEAVSYTHLDVYKRQIFDRKMKNDK